MSSSAFTPTVLTIGSAGGAGELNIINNPSGALGSASGWIGATASTTVSPLAPTVSTSLVIANAAAAEGPTSGGYYTISQLPSGLQNRKLKVEFYFTTPATDVYRVSVYRGSTRVALSTDSSGATTLPANTTGKFVAYFDTDNSASWSLNITRTSGTTGSCYITNVVVGPGIQPQGAVVGEWQNFTPVTFGATTYSSLTGRYRRVGDSAHIRISAVINVASGTYWFDVPSSIGTIDTTKVRNGNYQDQYGVASYYNSPTVNYAGIVQKTNVANRVRIVGPNGSNEWSQSTNIPTTPAAGHGLELEFTVPIAEWAGSGTVQLAQNDVEYASNSGNVTAAGGSDTTSFAYGPNGTPILAYNSSTVAGNSSTSFRVQFQTPVQSGDQVVVEINDGSGWFTAAQRLPGINTSGASYGIVLVSNSSTQYTVAFGNAGFNASGAATYAAAGSPWSSITSWRWRVRKSSAGAAVGFGIVSPGVSAGLVSASGLPGNTTGNAIAAGYVGERIAANPVSSVAVAASTSWANIISITLTPGIWLVSGTAQLNLNTIAGWNFSQVNISTSSSGFDANNLGGLFTFYPGSATSNTGSPLTYPLGTRIFNVSVNTPIYIVGRIDYSSQTNCAWSTNTRLDAVRIA